MTGRAVKGTTGLLGIVGWPVEHSLSPVMQNAVLQALGLDFVYVPFPVHPQALPDAIRGLRAIGITGFNVTIPHKSSIINLLDDLSPDAHSIGAVNTVKREGERLVGYNTDGVGLISSLREDLGFLPSGKSVLVLGAGGAARAAVVALLREAAGRIVIANRHPERGEELLRQVRGISSGADLAHSPLDILADSSSMSGFDLVLNTTSVGMGGTVFPDFEAARLGVDACVYDMVYAPIETPLLSAARARELRCANGLGMLAAQGEAAFAIWTGVKPPNGMMKACLLTALGGQVSA